MQIIIAKLLVKSPFDEHYLLLKRTNEGILFPGEFRAIGPLRLCMSRSTVTRKCLSWNRSSNGSRTENRRMLPRISWQKQYQILAIAGRPILARIPPHGQQALRVPKQTFSQGAQSNVRYFRAASEKYRTATRREKAAVCTLSRYRFFVWPMTITINEDLRAYIDPLTEDEYAALERSLLSEGCRDALVLWGDLLVDGHNRYSICQTHGIAFNTVQNQTFQSMDDVHLWMIDNHLGRRSVSDFQRGVLALRKKEIVSARLAQAQARQSSAKSAGADVATQSGADPVWTREAVARTARVSSATLGQIEKIQKTAAPELVSAVKAGVISINAAAAVASLPGEKQVAAVAGGKKELRQVARQVREARLPAKPEPAPPPSDATPDQLAIHRLTLLVTELTEERDQLKKKVQHLTTALAEARGGQ
jgi:hypothetical protein